MADDGRGPEEGAGQDPADAAPGFHRAVPDHGRPAGDHPPARPAAARVPAAHARGDGGGRRGGRRFRRRRCSARAAQLHESNPMLGHRGCRLGITYPEIYEMQARAIFEAAADVQKEIGETVEAEIMIPLVSIPKELSLMKRGGRPGRRARSRRRPASRLPYLVGTMIELPRAACWRARSPRMPQFFSFGTNDLTQTTYGLSRDDAGALPRRPTSARASSRRTPSSASTPTASASWCRSPPSAAARPAPNLKLGICGEHGGDPASIHFCAKVGLGLRLLLALPRADRQAGGGAGGAHRHGRPQGRGVSASADAACYRSPMFALPSTTNSTVTPALSRGPLRRSAPSPSMDPGSRCLSAAVRGDGWSGASAGPASARSSCRARMPITEQLSAV